MTQVIEMAGGGGSLALLDAPRRYRGYSISATTSTGELNNLGNFSKWNGMPPPGEIRTSGQTTPNATLTEVVRAVFYDLNPDDSPFTLEKTISEMFFSSFAEVEQENTTLEESGVNFTLKAQTLVDIITEKFDPDAKNFTTIGTLARTNIISQNTYGEVHIGDQDEEFNIRQAYKEASGISSSGFINMAHHVQDLTYHGIMFRLKIAAVNPPSGIGDMIGNIAHKPTNGGVGEGIGTFTQATRAILTI